MAYRLEQDNAAGLAVEDEGLPGTALNERQIGLLARAFSCDAALASEIGQSCTIRRFRRREAIPLPVAKIHAAWMLLRGLARVTTLTSGGQQVLVCDIRPGDLFGKAIGLAGDVAAFELRILEAAEFAQFRANDFNRLVNAHHGIALTIASQTKQRLSEATRRMVEGATLSATGRIHAEILRRARLATDMTIRPAPVLADLAMEVQTTRETVSRAISQLERRGIVLRDAKGLKVVSPSQLEGLVY